MSDKTATETVYVTNEESHVMSEKVQHLAASVYKEFEKVIKRYDEEVVKDLMPLVVGILETLDAAFTEKQELDVEIELLRDDNEQLLTQYEREKQLRKAAEQKYLEMEDSVEGIRTELEDKVDALESILRMSEIKAKNAADHVNRLEEKEQEMKLEHNKLNERYLELLRNHVDYRERTKILMGSDKLSELSGMSPKIMKGNLHLHGVRPMSVSYGAIVDLHNPHDSFDTGTPHSTANVSLKSELDAQTPKSTEKEQLTDSIDLVEQSAATKPSRQPLPNQAGSENVSEALGSGPADTTSAPARSLGSGLADTTSAPARSVIDQISSSQIKHGTGYKLETEIPIVLRRNQANPEDEGRFVDLLSYEEDSISGLNLTLADIIATTPELEESHESLESQGSLNKRKSMRNDNSLFDELTEEKVDIAEVDFGSNITGRAVNPGDYASSDSGDEHEENEEEEEEEEEKEEKEDDENDRDSVGDNFFGIDKEVEKLIVDNVELMATKNALNIVKDDLIAKVDELTSEQELLREEITSLQTMRGRLNQRITQLEEELKKAREEQLAKEKGEHGEDDEEKVDFAQRKRFTRVEMARVLMERNQYKERLMELQEAVRWTEMIRASKNNPQEIQTKKKSSVWNFFSNLFSSSNKPKRQQQPTATVKYNAPTSHMQPVVEQTRKSNPKTKAFDFLQEDVISDKIKKERIKERQEQYKQVQAHVKKDDGRMHAYGWSLPAKFPTHAPREDTSGKPQVPVPVPVYCRPLFDNQNGWKIWCAAGVNLTGGKTRDGGSIVGASVFYSDPPPQEKRETVQTEVDKLDEELKDHDKTVKELETEQLSSLVWVCTAANEASRVSVIDANNPADILETFRVSVSHILCIASIPGAMENDYPVAEEILNAEAPALPKETVVTSGTSPGGGGESSGLGGLTFVQCATGGTSPISSGSPVGSLTETEANSGDISIKVEESGNEKDSSTAEGEPGGGEVGGDPLGAASSSDIPQTQVFRAKGSPASSGSTTPTHSARLRVSGSATDLVTDGRASPVSENEIQSGEAEKLSSVLPTMWMGSHGGNMYVHSSVSNWKRCLHSVKLRDAVLGIVHVKGRVLVSLADGTVAIFHRSADGQWDLLNYHLIDLGKPKQSIRCMTVVAGKYVWCGYNNKVHIIDPQSMAIEKSFDAHPRKESLVRQLCWVGDGVWVSIRLDSTLRLYHAYTHQHLQDVDIEPYVSKMLGTGKLGFSFVRITSLLISCNRLWIGTGNGVIISVPLSENNKQPMITTSTSLGRLSGGAGRPGGVVRVYSDPKTESVTPGSFIPYCSMAQAQLSFHGHKDAVKFFVSVPVPSGRFGEPSVSESFLQEGRNRKGPLYEAGIQRQGLSAASDPSTSQSTPPPPGEALPAPPSNTRLILSGGEGYVDFRLGDVDDDDPTAASRMANDDDEDPRKASSLTKVERSHIIVWQDC